MNAKSICFVFGLGERAKAGKGARESKGMSRIVFKLRIANFEKMRSGRFMRVLKNEKSPCEL